MCGSMVAGDWMEEGMGGLLGGLVEERMDGIWVDK